MNRGLKLALAIYLASLVVLVLSQSFSLAADPTVVTFLTQGNPQYLQNTRTVLDAVERANPGIKIDMIVAERSANEEVQVMIAGGVAPDIVRLTNNGTLDLGVLGLLTDLTPFIERDPDVDFNDFYVPAFQSLAWEGRTFALPMALSIDVPFINTDLFDAAGSAYPDETWSWEEDMIAVGRRITRDVNNDGRIDQYFLSRLAPFHWKAFLFAAGGKFFTNDTPRRFAANTEAGIESLQFMADLINVHGIAPPEGQWVQFATGNSAYELQGSFAVADNRLLQHSFSWDLANISQYKGGRATRVWPETPLAIPVTAQHKEEAWQVIKYITSEEGQNVIADLGLGTPFRLSVARERAQGDGQPPANAMAVVDALMAPQTDLYPRIVPGWDRMQELLRSRATQPVLRGEKAPAQALAEVEEAINAILEEALANVRL